MSYEQEEYEKLKTVVRAALQNPSSTQSIEIKARGYSPAASVTIEAYILEKFLTPPKSE
jgi:hypothetical protein